MIIPVWEGKELPQDNLEIQEATIPETMYIRILVQSPTLGTLDMLKQVLVDAGVPLNAELGFSQWNSPDTSWYVYAKWCK